MEIMHPGGISTWAGESSSTIPPGKYSMFLLVTIAFYREDAGANKVNQEGWAYAAFLFQLSLATTASTIVSGGSLYIILFANL